MNEDCESASPNQNTGNIKTLESQRKVQSDFIQGQFIRYGFRGNCNKFWTDFLPTEYSANRSQFETICI